MKLQNGKLIICCSDCYSINRNGNKVIDLTKCKCDCHKSITIKVSKNPVKDGWTIITKLNRKKL